MFLMFVKIIRVIVERTDAQVIIKRRSPRGQFITKASLRKPITSAPLAKVKQMHKLGKKTFKCWSKREAAKVRL